jgi:hypothetical protein
MGVSHRARHPLRHLVAGRPPETGARPAGDVIQNRPAAVYCPIRAPLHRANVWKRRFRFALPACRAELDQLLINGAALETLAIESEDPQAVREVQSLLRLEDCENQSYPLALSRIPGITPLPREEDYG